MSLYVFNIFKDRAVVSADTRMCGTKDGIIYQLNDLAQKIFIIGDFIITSGGVASVCDYILKKFVESKSYTIERLHQITLDTVANIEEIAVSEKWIPHEPDYRDNPYLLEFCAVRYDQALGHNVFYNISTAAKYSLIRMNIDGIKRPSGISFGGAESAICYGGIDTEIVKDYFHKHEDEVKCDYLTAITKAYTLATSEKIGGSLVVAIQNKDHIDALQRPLKDSRPIRRYRPDTVMAYNIVGEKFSMESQAEYGGAKQFSFDAKGAFLNNSTMLLQKDGGGQLLFDPRYGIVGGQNGIYSMEGTTVFPSFINKSGGIILDDEGMPKNANFFLDLNTGNPYFRGTVIAKDGKFTGEIEAKDFKLPNGDSYVSALRDGKIAGENIDAKGINIKDDNGNTVLYMDKTGIHWTEGNEPMKYQFSIDGTSWHDTMQSTDKYRRDSLDSGNTWGSAYQFRGTDGVDGTNGSDGTDGDPKGYLQSIKVTEITQDNVKSALIEGAVIRGGRIESETTIDVGTNAKIGEKLIIRGDNLYNGVEFCHDDGSMIAEIYVDPQTARMDIVSTGSVYINGEKYSSVGKFG